MTLILVLLKKHYAYNISMHSKQEKLKKKEEVKRLQALKRKEVVDRLHKIQGHFESFVAKSSFAIHVQNISIFLRVRFSPR
jgi:hypothetical protein